jgi:hypothetical protein
MSKTTFLAFYGIVQKALLSTKTLISNASNCTVFEAFASLEICTGQLARLWSLDERMNSMDDIRWMIM